MDSLVKDVASCYEPSPAKRPRHEPEVIEVSDSPTSSPRVQPQSNAILEHCKDLCRDGYALAALFMFAKWMEQPGHTGVQWSDFFTTREMKECLEKSTFAILNWHCRATLCASILETDESLIKNLEESGLMQCDKTRAATLLALAEKAQPRAEKLFKYFYEHFEWNAIVIYLIEQVMQQGSNLGKQFCLSVLNMLVEEKTSLNFTEFLTLWSELLCNDSMSAIARGIIPLIRWKTQCGEKMLQFLIQAPIPTSTRFSYMQEIRTLV